MRILSMLAASLLDAPAFAQETVEADTKAHTSAYGSGTSVSGEALLLSDYRFRGISRSERDPAVQGQITASGASGWYAGGRGTSLRRAGALGGAQLDLYAGYGANLDLATSVDAGVLYYVFPDGDGKTDYFEPYASLSHQLGPVLGTLGAKYAPEQQAIGGDDSLYLFGEVEAVIPATPITAIAQIGRQDGGLAGSYWNWSLGARYTHGAFVVGLRYVDTDVSANPNAEAGLIASAGMRF